MVSRSPISPSRSPTVGRVTPQCTPGSIGGRSPRLLVQPGSFQSPPFHIGRLGGHGRNGPIGSCRDYGGPTRIRRSNRRDSMTLFWLYVGSVLGLLLAIGGVIAAGVRQECVSTVYDLGTGHCCTADMFAARCRHSLADWSGQGAWVGRSNLLHPVHGHFPARASSYSQAGPRNAAHLRAGCFRPIAWTWHQPGLVAVLLVVRDGR